MNNDSVAHTPENTEEAASTAEHSSSDQVSENSAASDASSDTSSETEMSVEQLRKELEKTRREAAGHRVERNKLREQLAGSQSLEERVKLLEAEKEQAHAQAMSATRDAIASKAGVPADLIVGDTAEDMQAFADKLVQLLEQRAPSGLPVVGSAGRVEEESDADSLARRILGV
ncbi:hypothetical protein [Corynebacterium sp. TAE3-ERU2]|uniref:hypothetical protein n=1 Tax=Corynebacterium sp. TAE3-ERU2 TaxID=2849497 RepID=UPI001C44CC17|nr:hypothetical protein [Corynebacterium sp. TAE3-ERU2]MBV7302928.1 hypothetical protein [Corynebacterium sp. TAE3-ERU2]